MKRILTIVFLLLIGCCAMNVAQVKNVDPQFLIDGSKSIWAGQWNHEVCWHFDLSDSLVVIIGGDTVYSGGKIGTVEVITVNFYKEYRQEFQRDKESSIYWAARSFALNPDPEFRDLIIKKIAEIEKREPTFEGFMQWYINRGK